MRSVTSISTLLFLSQLLAPSVTGSPIPDNGYCAADDPGCESRFLITPPDPVAPSRPCDPYCVDPTFRIDGEGIFLDKPTWIILIGIPENTPSQKGVDFKKELTGYAEESLPYLLNQLVADKKTVPDLVKQGVPMLVDTVLSTAAQKNVTSTKELQKWFQKVLPKDSCTLFAAAAIPMLSRAYDIAQLINGQDSSPTTQDIDFFLNPVYGSLAKRDDIEIHYGSFFPPLYGNVASVLDNRIVYVQNPESAAKYRATPSSPGNPDFKDLVRVLIPQYRQVAQWSSFAYYDYQYQLRYLKSLCEAKFVFGDNKYEKEIAASKYSAANLLDSVAGKLFFEVWTARNLFNTLGLPTTTVYTPTASKTCDPAQVYSLKFEMGSLQIKKCGACSKVVTTGSAGSWVGTGC